MYIYTKHKIWKTFFIKKKYYLNVKECLRQLISSYWFQSKRNGSNGT